MSNTLDWAGILSGPVFGAVGVWGKGFYDRNFKQATVSKIDADSAQVITEVALALVTPLKEELAELRKRIEDLEGLNAAATGKLRRALAYIKELRFWIEVRHPNDDIPPAPLDIEL